MSFKPVPSRSVFLSFPRKSEFMTVFADMSVFVEDVESVSLAPLAPPEQAQSDRHQTTGVYVTVHGHFYQPPRENPYLDTIERQPSASPFHNWNERIHPSAIARMLLHGC